MAARYQITETITANGIPFRAGDVADEGEIEAGCLVSMLRLGQAVPLPDQTAVPSAVAEAKPPAIGPAKPGRR